MRLTLTVEVDGTHDECEEVLDQLDELIEDKALLILGPRAQVSLVKYKEVS